MTILHYYRNASNEYLYNGLVVILSSLGNKSYFEMGANESQVIKLISIISFFHCHFLGIKIIFEVHRSHPFPVTVGVKVKNYISISVPELSFMTSFV